MSLRLSGNESKASKIWSLSSESLQMEWPPDSSVLKFYSSIGTEFKRSTLVRQRTVWGKAVLCQVWEGVHSHLPSQCLLSGVLP